MTSFLVEDHLKVLLLIQFILFHSKGAKLNIEDMIRLVWVIMLPIFKLGPTLARVFGAAIHLINYRTYNSINYLTF